MVEKDAGGMARRGVGASSQPWPITPRRPEPSGSAGHRDDLALRLPALVRMFPQRASRLSWFLGAGASVMSNVPTAGDLIRQFRHTYYCSETGQRAREIDERDPRVQEQIAGWFRQRGDLPQPGDPDEYAALFELVHPSARDRASVISRLVGRARPNYGHHILAAFMASDLTRIVWTTNFDDLAEAAGRSLLDSELVQPRRPLAQATLDSADIALRCLNEETWPLVGKIHGDFLSDRLKNTTAELREQDRRMRTALVESCRRFGLIVVGYSGRDKSVMDTLLSVLNHENPYPQGLFWCHQPGFPPGDAAVELLAAARSRGVEAYTVEVDNFVELMSGLEKASHLPDNIDGWLSSRRPSLGTRSDPRPPLGAPGRWPVIRFNAVPIFEMPSEAMIVKQTGTSRRATSPPRADELLGALRRSHARGLIAVRNGGQFIAVGERESLTTALREFDLVVSDERTKILVPDAEGIVDAVEHGLVHDALTIALGRTRGLRHVLRSSGDHMVRVEDSTHEGLEILRRAVDNKIAGHIGETGLRWAEAVVVGLDWREGQWWLTFTPDIWVAPVPDGKGHPLPTPDVVAERKRQTQEFTRERKAARYNRTTAALLDAWVRLLIGSDTREVRSWNLEDGAGLDARFVIGNRTAWSRPLQSSAAGLGS